MSPVLTRPASRSRQSSLSLRSDWTTWSRPSLGAVLTIRAGNARSAGHTVQPRQTVQTIPAMNPVKARLSGQSVSTV